MFIEGSLKHCNALRKMQLSSICKLPCVRWLKQTDIDMRVMVIGSDEACSWFIIFETWPTSPLLLRPTRRPCRATPQPELNRIFLMYQCFKKPSMNMIFHEVDVEFEKGLVMRGLFLVYNIRNLADITAASNSPTMSRNTSAFVTAASLSQQIYIVCNSSSAVQ